NVEQYLLEVGTTAGANDIYFGYQTDTSQLVTGLPDNGCSVYARLWSDVPGHPSQWLYNDYEYYTVCGKNWVLSYGPTGGPAKCAVAYGDSKYVVVGYGEIMTSPDGTTWTKHSSLPQPNSPYTFPGWDITYAENTFVACGWKGNIATSTDGINWTWRYQTDPQRELYTVIYDSDNSRFIVGGGYGTLLMSYNSGVTWTKYNTGGNLGIREIIYTGTKYVLCAGSGKIAYSNDGINWTSKTIDPNGTHLFCLGYGNGTYVTAGNAARIYTSTDAVTWYRRSNPLEADGNVLWAVIWNGCNFVILGDNKGNPSTACITSPDGITWTTRNAGTNLHMYGGKYFPHSKLLIGVGEWETLIACQCGCCSP
ncbi:MAG: sialidase family protein, partial [Planctomycetota bacterium]